MGFRTINNCDLDLLSLDGRGQREDLVNIFKIVSGLSDPTPDVVSNKNQTLAHVAMGEGLHKRNLDCYLCHNSLLRVQ